MAETANNRIWLRLTDSELVEVEQGAAVRGLRVAELARSGLLSLVRGLPVEAAPTTAPEVVAALARLTTLVEALAEDREEVRATLTDIAHAVGTLAGSIEPDDGGADAFGP
jgi:hypothetical protein